MYGTRWLHNNYYEYKYFHHVLSLFEYNGNIMVNAAQVMELMANSIFTSIISYIQISHYSSDY